jgi:hypothetical protein
MKPVEKLIEYIKSHDDWESRLAAEPYNLQIKRHPTMSQFVMFTYRMIETKWDDPMVKAARGLILEIDDNSITVASHSFDKFFNWGEGPVDLIDWDSVITREKIDGSLIKYGFWGMEWRWNTNNSFGVDAQLPETALGGGDKTFKDLINLALINEAKKFGSMNGDDEHAISFIGSQLRRPEFLDWTISFELVSPFNRVVIQYDEPKLWLLAARNNKTHEEMTPEEFKEKFRLSFDIPKLYPLKTLDDLLKQKDLLKNKEGFVVQDAQFHRAKLKADSYLKIHRLKDANGNFSTKRLFECIQSGSSDDVKAGFPEYKSLVTKMELTYVNAILYIIGAVTQSLTIFNDPLWKSFDEKRQKKEYALIVLNSKLKLFSKICFDSLKTMTVSKESVKAFIDKLDWEEVVKIAAI